MTKKTFYNSLANSQDDVLQQFIDLLNEMQINYCVIGGLAVNAFVEPVVSLDLDIIITAEDIDKLCKEAEKMFTIEKFSHSLNFNSPQSDLRIQVQTDPRYQSFISKATNKKVMGYDMKVAGLEDILQGKIWAYSDNKRRKSKQQKDLADIYRLVEAFPQLKTLLPEKLRKQI